MNYVDGFIVPVPKNKIDDYTKLAKDAAKIWKEYGAIDYVECIADDAPVGELTSFPRSVQLKDDETVIFAWITYKSREHRDEVNAKVMKDPRIAGMDMKNVPFDGKRMIFGGFKPFVQMS